MSTVHDFSFAGAM